MNDEQLPPVERQQHPSPQLELDHDQQPTHAIFAAFAASTHGLVVTDARQAGHPIVYCNPAFEWLTGYSQAEILGRNCRFLQGPETDPGQRQAIGKAIHARREYRGVVRNYRKDGTAFWNELIIAPVYAHDGTLTHFIGLQTDVTPRIAAVAAQQTRLRQRMQAEKLESLGLLAAGIAHDFNNLLAIIQGNIDLALLELAPGHAAEPALLQALSGIAQAKDMTRLLFTYAGRSRPAAQPLDLNALIGELVALLRSSISPAIALRSVLAPDLPTAFLDAGQTRQVVMNLMPNASDAIGDGPGEVMLTTRACVRSCAELDQVLAGEECAPGAYLQLTIADSGRGMDSSTLAQIFEPFFSTKPQGLGLGLATVLGLLRAQGGALQVQSSPGLGTTFTVYFPLHAVDAITLAVASVG